MWPNWRRDSAIKGIFLCLSCLRRSLEQDVCRSSVRCFFSLFLTFRCRLIAIWPSAQWTNGKLRSREGLIDWLRRLRHWNGHCRRWSVISAHLDSHCSVSAKWQWMAMLQLGLIFLTFRCNGNNWIACRMQLATHLLDCATWLLIREAWHLLGDVFICVIGSDQGLAGWNKSAFNNNLDTSFTIIWSCKHPH